LICDAVTAKKATGITEKSVVKCVELGLVWNTEQWVRVGVVGLIMSGLVIRLFQYESGHQ
jgi:hypothetical protein